MGQLLLPSFYFLPDFIGFWINPVGSSLAVDLQGQPVHTADLADAGCVSLPRFQQGLTRCHTLGRTAASPSLQTGLQGQERMQRALGRITGHRHTREKISITRTGPCVPWHSPIPLIRHLCEGTLTPGTRPLFRVRLLRHPIPCSS